MRIPLRLNAIEQEHLQELYDAAGVARDELPYTEQFEKLWQDFHDRTFKNADHEQVFGALLRYVRSSSCVGGKAETIPLSEGQAIRVRDMIRRYGKGGRILPYSSEFDAALTDFAILTKTTLSPREFWLALCQTQGRPRRASRPASPAVLTQGKPAEKPPVEAESPGMDVGPKPTLIPPTTDPSQPATGAPL
ncbi:MAG TPA: hypothetical protein VHP11_00610 [Tepidisphaeraceae bacterium]|nr:hypothetical protein [Tepidisphaeraceae bacterium]